MDHVRPLLLSLSKLFGTWILTDSERERGSRYEAPINTNVIIRITPQSGEWSHDGPCEASTPFTTLINTI